ncbi:Reverse_transcriptase (RNA-dependent DNA polymerase) [Hexamita inflata]|uniref:Reverse_transcriptase (RNA-dependent DNA polymerase) n=1 Tax=Hexamita inflata TaxID=28002 RepID=A0ABP1HFQ0_9EUKA
MMELLNKGKLCCRYTHASNYHLLMEKYYLLLQQLSNDQFSSSNVLIILQIQQYFDTRSKLPYISQYNRPLTILQFLKKQCKHFRAFHPEAVCTLNQGPWQKVVTYQQQMQIVINQKLINYNLLKTRPIACAEQLLNVLHRIVKRRIQKDLVIDPNQYVNQACGQLQAKFKVAQAIKNTIINFDVKSAFNSLRHDILARNLNGNNIGPATHKYIMYATKARWSDHVKDIKVGVSLSCPLAMHLFASVISELIYRINQKPTNEERFMVAVGYADDILIMVTPGREKDAVRTAMVEYERLKLEVNTNKTSSNDKTQLRNCHIPWARIRSGCETIDGSNTCKRTRKN